MVTQYYQEGYSANISGIPRHLNPYDVDQIDKRVEWFMGWDDADGDV